MSWFFPKNKDTHSTNPDMAFLLNDLNKLDAADNNSTEPNPTNVVAEDKDNNGSFIDVYWSVEIASRDKDAQ